MNKILLILLTIFTCNSYAKWEAVNNGIYGGSINFITSYKKQLFLEAGYNAIYNSSDNGRSWRPFTQAISKYSNSAIAFLNNDIFVSTVGSGIYKSTDWGHSWNKTDSGLSDSLVRTLLVIGDKLIAGTDRSGIFISNDIGNTWKKKNTGLFSLRIHTLKQIDDKIFAGTYQGIYMSSDSGNTWIPRYTDIQNLSVSSVDFKDHDIVIGTNKGVFISTDEGLSWSSKIYFGSTLNSVKVHGDNIYAATSDSGIYFSSNNGKDWSFRNQDLTCFNVYHFFTNEDRLFAATWCGLYYSVDEGLNWKECNQGIESTWVLSIKRAEKDLFVSSTNGIFRSSDNGNTWIKKSEGLKEIIVSSVASDKGILYASSSYGYIYNSTDNGNLWLRIFNKNISNFDWLDPGRIRCLAVKDNYIFAGTDEGLIKSTDKGITWNSEYKTIMNDPINLVKFEGNSLILSASWGNLFLSEDYCESWLKLKSKVSTNSLSSFIKNYDTIFVGYSGYGMDNKFYPGFIHYSTNNGIEWLDYNTSINELSVNSFQYMNGLLFIASRWGFYISPGDGLPCELYNDGLGDLSIGELVIDGDYLFAGTFYGGLYRLKISDIFSNVEDYSKEFIENSLFPNPSTDYVYYKLNTNSFTDVNPNKIEVLDIYGDILMTFDTVFTSERKTDSGINYESDKLKIDVRNLAKGQYFVKVGYRVLKFIKL